MATQIARPRTLANFKTGGPRKKKAAKRRDARPGMSEEHLALIRKLPCAACLRTPAGTVHHLKSGTGERGMGLRSTDKWGIPLCMAHHDEVERAGTRNERGLCKTWGFDPHDLARALWASTGRLEQMARIVISGRLPK
jgi:hypothetical protein